MVLAVACLVVLSLAAVGWFAVLTASSLLLGRYGAAEAGPDQAPLAHAIVDELAAAARCPRPRLFVMPAAQPNGFALVGRDGRIVVLTEGVFDTLDATALRGLLALLVALTARSATRLDTALAALAVVSAPLVLPTLILVRSGLRGERWNAIDEAAVQLAGAGAVSAALKALDPRAGAAGAPRPIAAWSLFCVRPEEPRGWLDRALATHPPVSERVARLGAPRAGTSPVPHATPLRGVRSRP